MCTGWPPRTRHTDYISLDSGDKQIFEVHPVLVQVRIELNQSSDATWYDMLMWCCRSVYEVSPPSW